MSTDTTQTAPANGSRSRPLAPSLTPEPAAPSAPALLPEDASAIRQLTKEIATQRRIVARGQAKLERLTAARQEVMHQAAENAGLDGTLDITVDEAGEATVRKTADIRKEQIEQALQAQQLRRQLHS